MAKTKVPALKGISTGISADGRFTVVEFNTSAGTSAIPLDETNAARLVSHILNQALACSAITGVKADGLQQVHGTVVPLTGLGIAPGQTPQNAILALQIGNLRLAFQTSVAHLMHEFRKLEQAVGRAKDQSKPN